MAPSVKTYTIRNESARKPKKIDSLDIIRTNPPEFRHTAASISTHPAKKSTTTAAPTLQTVPERPSAPLPASSTTEEEESTPVVKTVRIVPLTKPLKPILKPAPAVLTDTQAIHRNYSHRRTPSPPQQDDKSNAYVPKDLRSPNISPASSRSYRSTDHIIESRRMESTENEKSRKVTGENKNRSMFSFSCFRPRKKPTEKPAPSFRVLNTRVSGYDSPAMKPLPTPPKSRYNDTTSQDASIPRYKFLYPKVPENIPGTAGTNKIPQTCIPKPLPKPVKPSKKATTYTTPSPPTYTPTTTPISPLPTHRIKKKLSSHLSRHPAIRSLMTQYPTVEMYEKRTGFDTYFDTPYIEYSHSYWTSLNRPPSPFKRTKPLKVKFETPVTKPKRVPTPGPNVKPGRTAKSASKNGREREPERSTAFVVETYGPKRDLGVDVNLVDEYSYPYSPEDYHQNEKCEGPFQFGFPRDSIEEVALLGGRKFSSSTEVPRKRGKQIRYVAMFFSQLLIRFVQTSQ